MTCGGKDSEGKLYLRKYRKDRPETVYDTRGSCYLVCGDGDNNNKGNGHTVGAVFVHDTAGVHILCNGDDRDGRLDTGKLDHQPDEKFLLMQVQNSRFTRSKCFIESKMNDTKEEK